MRLTLRLGSVLALFCAAATAQNREIGFLFSTTVRQIVLGPRTATQYSLGFQQNIARQLIERPAGRLYLEMLFSISPSFQGKSAVFDGVNVSSYSQSAFFVTPGIRYHYNLLPRWAVYAAAGVGIAVRSNRSTAVEIASGVSTNSMTGVKVSPAANFGAGLDFRLSRSFSLRGEFREFRSTSLSNSLGGQSYPSTHVGFVFHH